MGRTYGSGPFLSLRSKRYFLCQAQEGSTFLRSKRCFLYLSQEGSVFLRNKRRSLCLSAQRQRYFYKKRGIPVKKKFKKVEPYVWILPSVLLMAISSWFLYLCIPYGLKRRQQSWSDQRLRRIGKFPQGNKQPCFCHGAEKHPCVDRCRSRHLHTPWIYPCDPPQQ